MSSKDNSILHIPCFFSRPTKQTGLNLTLFLAKPRFNIIELTSQSNFKLLQVYNFQKLDIEIKIRRTRKLYRLSNFDSLESLDTFKFHHITVINKFLF